MTRILRMAGLPDDRDNENLEFLALRKYTPEQRIRIVEQAIYNTPEIGLVIIDGIRDMVYDINSPSESTRIISKLMQWTDDRQIHIHTILHQNKGEENQEGPVGGGLTTKPGTRIEGREEEGTVGPAPIFPPPSMGAGSSSFPSSTTPNPFPYPTQGGKLQKKKRETPKTGKTFTPPHASPRGARSAWEGGWVGGKKGTGRCLNQDLYVSGCKAEP